MNRRTLLKMVLIGMMLGSSAFVIFLSYSFFKFEAWFASRYEIFAEMPYSGWEELYGSCATLAETNESTFIDVREDGIQNLPEPIARLEPLFVWIEPGLVKLKFSGRYSPSLYVVFHGNRKPEELGLYAEGFFSGPVYPRSDQRPVGAPDFENQ